MPTQHNDKQHADRETRPRANGPAEPPDMRELPHPLTFFVSGRERQQILRALRRIDGNRVYALRSALGLEEPGLAPD